MILNVAKSEEINYADLRKAFGATSGKRQSYELLADSDHILGQIKFDAGLMEQWTLYIKELTGGMAFCEYALTGL